MTMKGGFGDMMKQAQQMQEKIQKIQEEIANAVVTGESGAGLVKVTMTGRHDVRRVWIDDSLLGSAAAGEGSDGRDEAAEGSGERKEMLEDLLAAAVNDAVRKVEKNQQDRMAELTAGIPLPPGFKFPFS